MGRINIYYLMKVARTRLLRFIPYRFRRPILLVFSIIGFMGYLRFMIYFSNAVLQINNQYLISFQRMLNSLIDMLFNSGNKAYLLLVILTAILVIYKYCIKDDTDDNDRRYGEKKVNKSWYYQINSFISLMYLIVTIMTFMPVIFNLI